jgi:hypothetical protein
MSTNEKVNFKGVHRSTEPRAMTTAHEPLSPAQEALRKQAYESNAYADLHMRINNALCECDETTQDIIVERQNGTGFFQLAMELTEFLMKGPIPITVVDVDDCEECGKDLTLCECPWGGAWGGDDEILPL